jgi:hypothetical protein
VVTDTLDSSRFDLSTFKPTSVKIGKKTEMLNGDKNFVITMDLRPEVNALAQVSLDYNEAKGIATWTIESFDPYSMEPIQDSFRGALPVNTDGNGMGEFAFDIKLKPGMVEGESVSNRAGIVFDQEEVIMTPSWTNTVDATLPESYITDIVLNADLTANIHITATDELSKPWKYDLYVQEDTDGRWERKAVNIPVDSVLQTKLRGGIDYGFYVVVTDSAGNVEQKEPIREFSLDLGDMFMKGDVNDDGKVDLVDAVLVINHYVDKPVAKFAEAAADVSGDGKIDLVDAVKIINYYVGKIESLSRKTGFDERTPQ